ncbi:hypothetical protein D9M70_554620 [compost metagenome]
MLGRVVRQRLEAGGHLQDGVEAGVLAFLQQPLRHAQRMARVASDAPRQFHRRGHQRLGRHHARDQSPFERLRGIDGIAGEAQLRRARHAHGTRQQPRAAVARDQAELDEGGGEHGLLRRDADIAGAGEVVAGAERRAIDGGDDRYFEVR